MAERVDMKTFRDRLSKMTPMNNLMMSAMFEGNRTLTKELLSSILPFDLEVVSVEALKTIPGMMLGKSPQLDVLARLDDGRLVNIEVQIRNDGTDPKRIRYYKALIDAHRLMAGDDYYGLRDVYMIMITENDIFGMGCMVYPFDYRLRNSDLYLDIGEHIIYVNRSARPDSSRLADFLHDFGCSSPSDMKIEAMRKASYYYKNDDKGVQIMYDRYNDAYVDGMDDGIAIGREEGIGIGKEIGSREATVRMKVAYIRKYNENISEAAAEIGMSEEEFRAEAERLGLSLS